jgi:hypothetical protein
VGDEPDWHEEPTPGPARRPRPADGLSTLARIGGPDRGPGLLVAAIAIFVVVAVIKPWPGGGAARPTAPPGTPPPTARPSADPLALIRTDCQDPPGWRIFTREPWAGGLLRSWRSLEPITAASGPLDSAIPLVPISPEVLALGYCAPWTQPETPPADVRVQVWAIVPGPPVGGPDARALVLRSASPSLHPPLGALYAPPVAAEAPADGPTPALWPAGAYVFELTAAGYERWWAVRVVEDAHPPASSPTR